MQNNIKKVLALMLALVVLIACTACNNTSDPADTSSNTENTSGTNDTATDGTTTTPGDTSDSNGTTDTSENPDTPAEAVDEIVTNGGATIKTADLKYYDADVESVVYYTSEITPEALMAIYEALGVEITGENTAVKVHTGESDQSNHLRPDFIKELVQHVNGTIVESNTAYGGSRAQTAMHYQLAKDHGFTDIACGCGHHGRNRFALHSRGRRQRAEGKPCRRTFCGI